MRIRRNPVMVHPMYAPERREGPATDLTPAALMVLLAENDFPARINVDSERRDCGMANEPVEAVHAALALMPRKGGRTPAATDGESLHPGSWRYTERRILERELMHLPDEVLRRELRGARLRRRLKPATTAAVDAAIKDATKRRARDSAASAAATAAWTRERVRCTMETAAAYRDSYTVALCALALMPLLLTNAVQMRGMMEAGDRNDSAYPGAWDAIARTERDAAAAAAG